VKRVVLGGFVALAVAMCAVGCASGLEEGTEWITYPPTEPLPTAEPGEVPRLDGVAVSWAEGARVSSLDELRRRSDLTVVLKPTGKTSSVEVEQRPGDSVKVTLVTRAYAVVRPVGKTSTGVNQGDTIWVVEPLPGQHLLPQVGYATMFLDEFVYWLGDERPSLAEPVWSIVGGLQGLWIDEDGQGTRFAKADRESPELPEVIDEVDVTG